MNDNTKWITYWRIAATSGALPMGRFFALGLPPPNTPLYRPFTATLPQTKGGMSRQGYNNIAILWNDMDFEQLRTLRKIVEAGITGGVIYATIDRNYGDKLLNDFIDISGMPQPLTFTPIENTRGVMVQNINLVITNITITADPSTVL